MGEVRMVTQRGKRRGGYHTRHIRYFSGVTSPRTGTSESLSRAERRSLSRKRGDSPGWIEVVVFIASVIFTLIALILPAISWFPWPERVIWALLSAFVGLSGTVIFFFVYLRLHGA